MKEYNWERYGVTPSDLALLEERGKSQEQVWLELEALGEPRNTPVILDSARYDNGFLYSLELSEVESLLKEWSTLIQSRRMVFFVPAAGAASRQFEMLKSVLKQPALASGTTPYEIVKLANSRLKELEALPTLSGEEQAEKKSLSGVSQKLLRFWEEGIVQRKFPFVDALQEVLEKQGRSWEKIMASQDVKVLCHYTLDVEEGLSYSFLPKALLLFHTYPQSNGKSVSRLAVEEHIRALAPLYEGSSEIPLHFALSEEHAPILEKALTRIFEHPSVVDDLAEFGFCPSDVKVDWSFQSASTDAVALDIKSQQIARQNGLPLTRKAGHGALIENLARLDADGIWVQNIDNILYDNPSIKRAVLRTKQLMAALAFQLQHQLHSYIHQLQQCKESGSLPAGFQEELLTFAQQKLTLHLSSDSLPLSDPIAAIDTFLQLFDRPVMVSGYVPLKPGQKGGGPFVLELELDGVSVKKTNTVEGAEFEGGQSHPIFQSGICFNPVNFFIANQRYDGTRFDLTAYADPSRFFVSEKTDPNGNPILAYERPGLWNGALAQVLQVSIGNLACTFSAVKDTAGPESFLSELHQPGNPPTVTKLDRERGVVNDELAAWFQS